MKTLKASRIFYVISAAAADIESTASSNLNNNPISLFDNGDTTINTENLNQTNLVNNIGSMYGQILIYFIAVAAVIALLLFLRRYLMKRLVAVKSGSYMRVIDRLVVAQDKQITLIELKNKILIVGITQQRIETLAELARDDLDVLEQESTDGQQNSNAFVQMITEKLKSGDKPDNNKSNENGKK